MESREANDNDSDFSFEPEVEFSDYADLEERATTITSVVLGDGGTAPTLSTANSGSCAKDKHIGKTIMDWSDSGQGFVDVVINGSELKPINFDDAEFTTNNNARLKAKVGTATKGIRAVAVVNATVNGTKHIDTLPLGSPEIFTASQIKINVEDGLGFNQSTIDSLSLFSIKIVLEYPKLLNDSTFSDLYTKKTKTVYGIHKFNSARYGTLDWDIALLNAKGNARKLPTGFAAVTSILGTRSATATAIPSNYIPKVGEELFGNATTNPRRGFIYAVKAPLSGDTSGIYQVRCIERICSTATQKSSTYKYYTKPITKTRDGITTTIPKGFLKRSTASYSDTDETIWTKAKTL
jgi:hypothetical protein